MTAALCAATGCSNRKLEKANAAANAYCDCAKKNLSLPHAERLTACKAEEAAWQTAWKEGPGGDDSKALAIFDYQHACYSSLHE